MPENPSQDFPQAKIEPASLFLALKRNLNTRLWYVTLFCIVVAIVLTVLSLRSSNTRIVVRFQQGHGIKAGDALRYRGIDVGEVMAVELDQEPEGVAVTVALQPSAASIARSGSRFWIERPRFSLTRMSGLDTVVGSKYIAVLPGTEPSPGETKFVGLESPLTIFDEVVEITVRLRAGNGLDIGDPLKYRGIAVGEVTAVELNPELSGVTVRVRLQESARSLARAGSQFWVERPKVTLSSVRGLETLVGGRYLATLPGPKGAQPIFEFEGVDVPPAADERLEGGLDIILEADQRHGLEPGAPVTYRGLPIGHVITVGLSADAAEVEARIYVQPVYKQVVRDNSRFWSTSGIDLSVGLTGIQLSAETLATIAAGGVAVATPNAPGKPISTGHRFVIHRKPDSDWLEWRPHLLVGGDRLPDGATLPHPERAALRWREKRFGFERTRHRDGWLLPLADGRLLGPANLFMPDRNAIEGEGILEISGTAFKIIPDSIKTDGQLAVFTPISSPWPAKDCWPTERINPPLEPEDCLATTGPSGLNLSFPGSRLTASKASWLIDASVPVSSDSHGACVVSLKTGSLVGILIVESGRAQVALIGTLASADLERR